MVERRSLVDGVKAGSVDPSLEKSFVYGSKPKPEHEDYAPPAAATPEGKGAQSGNALGRVPLTTRVRSDYAAALKRASLERQLAGQTPNTLQDILEEAVGPWLRSNGYLS
jgi:hypothetical protein